MFHGTGLVCNCMINSGFVWYIHPYFSGLFQVEWNGPMVPELGDLPRQIWVKCNPSCLSVYTIGNVVLLFTPSTCTANLVLYGWVKSLQFICLSRIRWLHLRVPDLQKSCRKWHQATCPFEILSSMSTDMFTRQLLFKFGRNLNSHQHVIFSDISDENVSSLPWIPNGKLSVETNHTT